MNSSRFFFLLAESVGLFFFLSKNEILQNLKVCASILITIFFHLWSFYGLNMYLKTVSSLIAVKKCILQQKIEVFIKRSLDNKVALRGSLFETRRFCLNIFDRSNGHGGK